MTASRALDITSAGYQRNHLHDPEMPWQETNCYVDVWIELIHALGFEVEACLSFTLAADFEQDQWTFFKPPLHDIQALYGLRVEELTLWRSLTDQCADQIAVGNLPLLEADSYYLPDTVATDYQQKHVKTTIAINEIDLDAQTIAYFHNTGYHRLEGDDYAGLFRLNRENPEDYLPPYCEIIKTDSLSSAHPAREQVFDFLRYHVAHRPTNNPFDRFAAVFDYHLSWISDGGLDTYHAYVFASLRQCGAAFDLASRHLLWLHRDSGADLTAPAQEFEKISSNCKLLLLKLARVANGKPPRDLSGPLDEMSRAWQHGFDKLETALGQSG